MKKTFVPYNGMEHLFVPYKIALKLKQKGFDEPCLTNYNRKKILDTTLVDNIDNLGLKNSSQIQQAGAITAPLYQQVVDWFMTKHQLVILITIGTQEFSYEIYNIKKDKRVAFNINYNGKYYETLNVAILEALKLI
jgi:hypothetical protein